MIVLTAGRFGDAVARSLAVSHPTARTMPLVDACDRLEDIIATAAFVGVAVWRPYVAQCERLDAACHAYGIRWSLAQIDGETLSCGPLVIPGAGPCYRCYRRRLMSHHKSPDREIALRQAYESDASLGVAGFVAPMVAIAASALAEDARAPRERAGRLRIADCLNGTVLETEVIGVHGCAFCGPARSGATGARFVERLVPAVEELLA